MNLDEPTAGTGSPLPAASTTSASDPALTEVRTLGVIAFWLAVAALVIGSILAFYGGLQVGTGFTRAELSPGSTVDVNTISPEVARQIGLGSVISLIAWIVLAVLGLWAFIQGIVAVVKRRGRKWGIAAIVIAVLGVGAVAVLGAVGLAVGAATLVGGA